MGIKNQKTLIISGLAIIGTTGLGIVALNFAVDKISNIQPMLAVNQPPQAQKLPRSFGADDGMELNQPPPKRKRPERKAEPQFRAFDPKQRMQPPPPTAPPEGAMRRMRNGQQPPDIQRSNTPPDDRAPPMQYPPMYPPPQQYLSPEDQRRMEEDMQRMHDYYPDPGYYPPPEDYYEDYYPGYDDYYGPEGNLEKLEKDPKVTKDFTNPEELPPEFYPEPDREMIDDYLNEFYEE